MDLPKEAIHSQPLLTPLAIVDSRTIFRHGTPIRQILVQWNGLPLEETSWEDWSGFVKNYPSYNLEDKVIFYGGEQSVTKRSRKQPNWQQDYIME